MSVLLVIVYCVRKSAVAAVRVTRAVPLPVSVPVPPTITAAAGFRMALALMVRFPLVLKFVFAVTAALVLASVRSLKVVVVVPLMVCAEVPFSTTVPAPCVNAALFVKFPAMLMVVAVPILNVPAESVSVPLSVSVVALPPALNVCPALLTVILLNVCEEAVPLMLCAAAALLNVTVPVPGVNVPPLFVQFPAILMAEAVPASNVPAERVIAPFNVSVVVLPPTVSVCPDLFTVILLNVWLAEVPFIFCETDVLLNVTVLVPGVNVPPLLVQFPPTAILKLFASSVVPLPMLTFPDALVAARSVLVPLPAVVR